MARRGGAWLGKARQDGVDVKLAIESPRDRKLTPSEVEHLLRAYVLIRRHGVPIRSVEPGEKITRPTAGYVCKCGHKTPKLAEGKRGRRYLCAGHRCGKPWPTTSLVVSAGASGNRRRPSGEREREIACDVGVALAHIPVRLAEIVILWTDTRRVPHRRYARRERLVAEALRHLHPRAMPADPRDVAAKYDEAILALLVELTKAPRRAIGGV